MAGSVNDKFRKASGSTRPVVTTITVAKIFGSTTAELQSVVGWNTTTGVDYVMYRRVLNTVTNKYEEVVGTRIEGRGVLSGTTLSNMTIDAGTEPSGGYAADNNTVIMCAATAQWADDLMDGILTHANQDGTLKPSAVDAAIATGSIDTAQIADGAVTAEKLSTSAIFLGYAGITANFTTTATIATPVDVTGLTVTVSVPTGGRRLKITVGTSLLYNSTASRFSTIRICEGSTILGATNIYAIVANTGSGQTCVASFVPTSGSHTYKVMLGTDNVGGTAGIEAGPTAPAFILAELI